MSAHVELDDRLSDQKTLHWSLLLLADSQIGILHPSDSHPSDSRPSSDPFLGHLSSVTLGFYNYW